MKLSCALLIITASSVKGQKVRGSSPETNRNDLLRDSHLVSKLVDKTTIHILDKNLDGDRTDKYDGYDGYDRYQNARCRTDSGREGDDGEEYNLYKGYTKDECEQKCYNDYECTGFEWNKKKVCEIWNYESDNFRVEWVERSKGSYCYWWK
mmetsp:Transcript_42681/g.83907  ORF Transcript_42681/g.83907 Transcript_42681/m.83907 type:complete len:151 (-) Transcript_42681:291-743(-)